MYPHLSSPLDGRGQRVFIYAAAVMVTIAVVSAATVVVAFFLRGHSDLVNWVVWARAGFYTLGGVWLLWLGRRAQHTRDRSSFVRLRVVSILAPLGILALCLSPDSGYPFWMKCEQAGFGILLTPLAICLLMPSIARQFPKRQRSGTTTVRRDRVLVARPPQSAYWSAWRSSSPPSTSPGHPPWLSWSSSPSPSGPPTPGGSKGADTTSKHERN